MDASSHFHQLCKIVLSSNRKFAIINCMASFPLSRIHQFRQRVSKVLLLIALYIFNTTHNRNTNNALKFLVDKESNSTFLTARPTSKGFFFIPSFRWSYLGLSVKPSLEIIGFKFEENVDEVHSSLSAHFV